MNEATHRIRMAGHAALLLALGLVATGAFASGDLPPERNAPRKAVADACPEAKPAAPGTSTPAAGGEACESSARPKDAASEAGKPRSFRHDRFGAGFESRQGPAGGARRGRGAGR